MSANYVNPRIESISDKADGSALEGTVRLDPVKVIWIGGMLVFGTVGSAITISVSAVLLFILFTGVTLCLGHSLGMHRRFIHRSYDCPRWMEILFVHFGTLVGLAGPLGMLYTHDLRDWAQRQAQCHDYFSHKSVWCRDLYWQIFCSIKLQNPPPFEPEPEIDNDAVFHWMERFWMLQQLPWVVLFFALGGWGWVFWGICSRVSVSILGHWLIGYFAHNDGHRDWHVEGAAVQGHNISWASLLTMGESWHNNHHAFPYSAKLGLMPGQWDPGWWVLLLLEKLRLVENIVLPDSETLRPELLRI